MAPRTVRRVYGALRACFNYAVESELLSRTPCRGIRLPAVEPTVSRIPAVPEVVALVEAMRPQFAAMVWLGVVLGLRWGEVAGLRVKRVDLLRRTVTIAEQVSRDVGGIGMIGPPKSAAGRRTISIPIELAETLSAHLVSVGLTGADPDALLFSNAEGLPLDYSNWRRRVWLPAVEAAGPQWSRLP